MNIFRKKSKENVIKKKFNIPLNTKINLKNIRYKDTSKLKIGEECIIEGNIIFDKDNSVIDIGDRTFIGGGTSIISYESISIGSDVEIAWGCTIIDTNSHSIYYNERKNDVLDSLYNRTKDWSVVIQKPIKIRDKVWIGFNSIILKGVTIGEGAVIGAGSVVTKDVEEWTVVAGNPARFIKRIEK